jgi:hypothetical protein
MTSRFEVAIELAAEAGRLRGTLQYIADRLSAEECQRPDECKPNDLCALCEVSLTAEAALQQTPKGTKDE